MKGIAGFLPKYICRISGCFFSVFHFNTGYGKYWIGVGNYEVEQ